MVAQGERNIAWLSLDEDDDDVWQFIPYLLQALRPLYADWDADFWRDMEEQKLSAPSNLLLVGSLTSYTTARTACTLIIDDFHVINDRGAHGAGVFNQACACRLASDHWYVSTRILR